MGASCEGGSDFTMSGGVGGNMGIHPAGDINMNVLPPSFFASWTFNLNYYIKSSKREFKNLFES